MYCNIQQWGADELIRMCFGQTKIESHKNTETETNADNVADNW